MDGATETLIKSLSTPLATKSTSPTMAPGVEAERQRRVPYLAPELTDTIIDHLWNDPKSLAARVVLRGYKGPSVYPCPAHRSVRISLQTPYLLVSQHLHPTPHHRCFA